METYKESFRVINLEENGRNYSTWKFQVSILLKSEGIYDIVDSTNDNRDTSTEEGKKKFVQDDLKVQRIIVTSVNEKILTSLVSCKSAKEMWVRIQALFTRVCESGLHNLQQKFYTYKYENKGIAFHIATLENLAHELKLLGEVVSENMEINKILTSLPDEYRHFYSAWDSTTKEEKTKNNLTARLLMEEERLKLNIHGEVAGAFAARQYKQLKAGKKFEVRQGNENKSQKSGECFICGKQGHWKNECPSKGIHSKFNNKKTKGQPTYFMRSHHALMVSDIKNEEVWYLDSGATHHMCPKKEYFDVYEDFEHIKSVTIGNGEVIHATGCGTISVDVFTDQNGWRRCEMKNVLYVPDLKYNLFSSSAVIKKNHQIVMSKTGCIIYYGDEPIVTGAMCGNLVKLNLKKSNKNEQANFARQESVKVWHEKLCHQNVRHCKKLLDLNNICVSGETENFHCESCIFGKQHRNSFKQSESSTNSPGEIIHVDLCGPMEVNSIGGSKYFLLLKDDYSHYRFVYFLKTKSEVVEKLKSFIPKFKNETGQKIKIIRSDNGTEIKNKEVESLLSKYGIKHQLTVPYTPEQNGKAERDMRTLVEAARTMICHKNLDKSYWAEAINCVVYVLNRTSTSSIPRKTPFELYYNKKASIKYFQVFGSKVYVHIPKERRLKLDTKSNVGIFVGYSEEIKGYRVYFPEENFVGTCRDVIFSNEKEESNITLTEINKNNNCVNEEKMEVSNLQKEVSTSEEILRQEGEENQICEEESYKFRNRREIKPPSRYNDFHTSFLTFAEEISYEEACKDEEWKAAMEEEYDALCKNNTWELQEKPKDKTPITTKWVYTVKNNGRKKARLVARGFTQEYGIDYMETYSPVAQLKVIRMIIGVAATYNLKIGQFDVKTAFLNGELKEQIFIEQPKGFDDGSGKYCLLKKGLYGLKQSAKCWNEKLTETLTNYGLLKSSYDSCVFYKLNPFVILLIYVDDGLLVSKEQYEIDKLLLYLEKNFEIKVEVFTNFLGMEVDRKVNGSISLKQTKYIEKVLKIFNMENCNIVSTPGTNVKTCTLPQERTKAPYRQAIGCLLYLSSLTRPDVTFAVNYLSRYMEDPQQIHWEGIKRVFRYLKGTKDYGLVFERKDELVLNCFTDADFAGDEKSRKSTSGYLFTINNTPVDWFTRKQSIVTLSTTEAEYVAASEGVRELIMMVNFGKELNIINGPVNLHVDNQSAITLIQNEGNPKRTKHIDVRFHFIKENNGKYFSLSYIESGEQLADLLTKNVLKEKFEYFRSKLNIRKEC